MGFEKIKKLKSRIELERNKMEAKELQRLRSKRLRLEGRAVRSKLKQQEQSRINKAKSTIEKGKKKSSFSFGNFDLISEPKKPTRKVTRRKKPVKRKTKRRTTKRRTVKRTRKRQPSQKKERSLTPFGVDIRL